MTKQITEQITEQEIRGLKDKLQVGDKVKLFIDHVQGEQWVVFAGINSNNLYLFIDTGDLMGMNYTRALNSELLEDIKTIIPARYGEDKPFTKEETKWRNVSIKNIEELAKVRTFDEAMKEVKVRIEYKSLKTNGSYDLVQSYDGDIFKIFLAGMLKKPPLPVITDEEMKILKKEIKLIKYSCSNCDEDTAVNCICKTAGCIRYTKLQSLLTKLEQMRGKE